MTDFESALATVIAGARGRLTGNHVRRHFFSSPSVVVLRSTAAGVGGLLSLAAGATAPTVSGLGLSMARTRPAGAPEPAWAGAPSMVNTSPVSYTHLRAHETGRNL